MHKVTIANRETSSFGSYTAISIDGKELKNVVAYTIEQEVNSIARVQLEFLAEIEFVAHAEISEKNKISKIKDTNRFELLDIDK